MIPISSPSTLPDASAAPWRGREDGAVRLPWDEVTPWAAQSSCPTLWIARPCPVKSLTDRRSAIACSTETSDCVSGEGRGILLAISVSILNARVAANVSRPTPSRGIFTLKHLNSRQHLYT
jgi:hypothetical protein